MSEIELYKTVAKRRRDFHNNLAMPIILDIFQDAVDNRVDHPDLQLVAVFEDYFQEPKDFGAIDQEMLLSHTVLCIAFCRDSRIPKDFKIDALELAASMLWETAFINTVSSHNSAESVDERLELVDSASACLESATFLLQNKDPERTQRLLLKNVFTQVLKDIAAGEVTEATVEELLESLEYARSQLLFIENKREAAGLSGEISVLKHFWENYQKKGDKVAIPASGRAGSGHFRPDETHDIEILRQRRDESWIVLTPVEVKHRDITDSILNRYTKSHLAHVAANGTITLNGDHRKIAI